MTRKQKWTTGLAGVSAALVVTLMVGRHGNDVQSGAKVRADVLGDDAIVKALQDAKVPVNGLIVKSVGGVVVVRGNGDKAAVQEVLQRLNVQRIANMVVGYTGDDEAIRREAERQLAGTRALDGCSIRVSCDKGVLRVTGTVQNDLQVDVARSILHGVNGVQRLKLELAPAIASVAPRS